MENNPNNIPSRADRKIIERNRRNKMKALHSKLNSLIPRHHNSRELTSLPHQLGEAASYIKKLQTKVERMKEKKDSLIGGVERSSHNNITPRNNCSSSTSFGPKSPQIQIHEMGSSSLVIGLATDSNSSQFIFNDTIRILHEEGADIVNAGFSVVHSTAFHTIHLTVDYGDATSRISERLNKFIHDANATTRNRGKNDGRNPSYTVV